MQKKKAVTNEAILEAVLSLSGRIGAMEQSMATKEYVQAVVERAKDEILERFEPLERAVDKDALAIVDHESRIVQLEELNGIEPPQVVWKEQK